MEIKKVQRSADILTVDAFGVMDTVLAQHEWAARFDITLRESLVTRTDAYAAKVSAITRREMRFTSWGNSDCEVNRSPDGTRWLFDASSGHFHRSGT